MTDCFKSVFAELKSLMEAVAKDLECKTDTPNTYYLDTAHIMKNKQPLFFGSVQIRKNYVSYHLMPVYVNPALLQDISPELRKRMQGKSCFNFKTSDAALFNELKQLTIRGLADYRERGYV